MTDLVLKDFTAGWIPQDDPVGGRKNGLLKMDSVELDQTGALVMSGGVKNIFGTNYPADAHTLYSKYISGIQYRYIAMTNGFVARDTNNIIISGSTTRAGFGSAFDYVYIFSGSQRRKDNGITTSAIGITGSSAPVASLNGSGVLNGTYEYAQLNVQNNGSGYIAKSVLSLASNQVTAADEKISVNPDDTGGGNEAWIFRRGNKLDKWYLVDIRTGGAPYAAFDDNFSDQYCLDLNITTNEFLFTTNAFDLPQDVLEVAGPINGRLVLFTANQIVFTEPNSPDNYDVRMVRNFGSAQTTGSEIFLWAKQVGENAIIFGTTQAKYIVTGTFAELSDGILDVYVRTLTTNFPPIGRDATVYGNSVGYMSHVGWTLCDINGGHTFLCPPNTDRLYRGQTLNGYGGVPIYIFPATDPGSVQVRYPCAMARNKLWCKLPSIVSNNPSLPFASRMEIYDFSRQYWRPLPISPLVLHAQEDGAVMGFFNDSGTRNLREIDNQFDKTFNTVNQTISILTPFQDNGELRNRKETGTLKFRADTGGSNLTVKAYKDGVFTSPITLSSSINSSTLTEHTIDVSSLIGTGKNFAFEFSGQLANFRFTDLTIDYVPHPSPVRYFKILRQSLGEADGRKYKPRTWPFVIDTMGGNVTFTPSIDGLTLSSSIANTNGKRSFLHLFNQDVFGRDLSIVMTGNADFEVWNVLNPIIVQALPIGKLFDQVGPIELFRLGTLRKFEIRMLAYGTSVPYTIYLDDTAVKSGAITTVNGKEKVYDFNIESTYQGTMLKIELGPTNFEFHRISSRILHQPSGRDTENEWLSLDE